MEQVLLTMNGYLPCFSGITPYLASSGAGTAYHERVPPCFSGITPCLTSNGAGTAYHERVPPLF